MIDLLPCPFCGGPAEMDTSQGYRNMTSGRVETAVAIYCTVCGAQQSQCRGDIPDLEPEMVVELWNARALASPAMEGWRGIETAPKDGTAFMAWPCEVEGAIVAVKAWWYVHPSVSGWVTDATDCGDFEFEPTLWLPAPPSMIKAIQGGK